MTKAMLNTKEHSSITKDSEEITMDEIPVKYFKNNDNYLNHIRGEEKNVKGEIHRISSRLYMRRK